MVKKKVKQAVKKTNNDNFLSGYTQVLPTYARGNTDDIIRFTTLEKNGKKALYIRIGFNVLEKMGWNYKEKLGVYYKDESFSEWIICKAQFGYSLCKENDQKHGRLQITFNHPAPKFKSAIPEIELKKDHIKLTIAE